MIVFLKCCVDTILSVYLNVPIAWFILKMILVCPRVQLALWVVLLGPTEVLLTALLVKQDHLLPWAHTTLGPMARALLDHSKDFLLLDV